MECTKTTYIGNITDMRLVENPNFIIHKRNAYGPTTGGYAAEKPIAEIIQNALAQGFEAANLPKSNSSNDFTLSGELIDYDCEVLMGIWDYTVNSKLTVKLKLADNRQNKIVWRDTYFGKSSLKKWNIPVKESFSDAVTDFIRQVFFDELFLENLK
ncbi:MAG: hypothetical protein JXA96_04010 [Sedimentisphaerales bacterium]|nr:hypothetical protein [Sedimentisphaerales bacterium]